MVTACTLDAFMAVTMTAIAIWSNSLALLAELMRGVPMLAMEIVLLALMWRINRGKMAAYDYGTRKVEQFANLVAGSLLILGAFWLVAKMVARAGVPQDQPVLGMAAAVLLAALNLGINIGLFVALWRAARGGGSLILNGQVVSRLSKTLASAFVMMAIAVNAVVGPEGIGAWADLAGTTVVVGVMVVFGGRMVADALPHLVDRALGEEQQRLINLVLASRFDSYDLLGPVRTRTEGLNAWIEIELGFNPSRPVGEASAEAERVAAELRELVPNAQVVVIIRATRPPPT